ncbi:hypothetical protein, partial [Chryseobacterium sp. VD8]|uniref:hypothetical protein n=1 Tax=Chryseobacterium sp. VD8 TaxID=3081254 RepID=UPI00301B65C4
MMQNIHWETIYSTVGYVLKNYPLKIVLFCFLFLVLGLLISSFLVIILKKYKALSRRQKYYNWFVKLYIPAIFIVNIVFSLKIGLFCGVYSALKKDSYSISEQVYNSSTYYIFKDNRSKKVFIEDLRKAVKDLSQKNNNAKVKVIDIAKAYHIKNDMIDLPKNWMASMFVNRYGDKIYSFIIYGILDSVPNGGITNELSYGEFDAISEKLVVLNPENIEKSIVQKIQNLFLMILKSQFKTILKGILLIWVLLMCIPWFEFWIYT